MTLSLSIEDWEKLLVSEGLEVIGDSSFTVRRRGGWNFEYEEDRHGGGQTLGSEGVMLLDKEEDDPVLVGARKEILDIAARLPPKWSLLLQLRARGLSQHAIAERLGVRQPVISEQLQRILRVLPSLLETRPVTRGEIEDWVAQTRMPWRCTWEEKRVRLVEEYLKVWNAEHAAWKVGLLQSHTTNALVRPMRSIPEHPVSRVLLVIKATKHYPGLRNRTGEGWKTRGQREELPDYAKLLVRDP